MSETTIQGLQGVNSGSFQYRPLIGGEIRLLLVHPGKTPEPFQCSIIHRNILHPRGTPYTALSYTWGNPNDTITLGLQDGLNGHEGEIRVTRSFIAALEQFRNPDVFLALWADQVCINQSDDREKESQIRLMKPIYERASAVLSWLGPEGDCSDLAMEKIKDPDFMKEYNTSFPDVRAGEPGLSATLRLEESKEDTKRAWAAIHALMNRSYWSRTWILQEVTALKASQTQLCCGDKRIPFSLFLRFTHALRANLIRPNPLHPDIEKVLAVPYYPCLMSFLRGRRTSGEKRPLLELVQNVRISLCTDPRDKIYSMLNFASDIGLWERDIRPNLSQSPSETYTELALWHIRRYHNLDVFGHCGWLRGGDSTLPSWVPNWASDIEELVFPKYSVTDDPASEPLFRASGSFLASLIVNLPFTLDARHIQLSGVKISAIQGAWGGLKVREKGIQVEQLWRPVDKSRRCTLNGITLDEVFRKTIFTDLQGYYIKDRLIFRRGRPRNFEWPQGGEWKPGDDYPDYVNLKRSTLGRCAFYTTQPGAEVSGLMGLGPSHARPGDEVWMLKGGKMLYVLRSKPIQKNRTFRSIDLETGEAAILDIPPQSLVYELVGECFILGLMDGEILDMLGDHPRRQRPPPLKFMDKDFRKIGLI